MQQIHKYPRTRHIEGSRCQPGDEDLDAVPFRKIVDRNLVIEEKMDGANCGVSFTAAGELLLQSRGHFLTGGPRERYFDLFKQWATTHQSVFFQRLSDRYVMYGEWLYAKHTIFYDALPHYFLEFDILDVESGDFLSTERRTSLLDGAADRERAGVTGWNSQTQAGARQPVAAVEFHSTGSRGATRQPRPVA